VLKSSFTVCTALLLYRYCANLSQCFSKLVMAPCDLQDYGMLDTSALKLSYILREEVNLRLTMVLCDCNAEHASTPLPDKAMVMRKDVTSIQRVLQYPMTTLLCSIVMNTIQHVSRPSVTRLIL
jgi:hypothetical protein